LDKELLYRVALTFIPNIGHVLAKNLVSYCGSPEAVFKQSKNKLLKIPGIGARNAESILSFTDFKRVEEECAFIQKHKIKTLFYTDEAYPARLKHIADSPVILYCLGNADYNAPRMIGMVGTRRITDYGKDITLQLVEGLQPYGCTIVSGLLYGVDIAAHKAALDNALPTIGVVGHGLDRIYPAQHAPTAKKMLGTGGLLTEYPSNTNPDKENFPSRNRIVAGICDAVVIVETDIKGGSMITAEIAFDYNRDVFAIPGRTIDERSKGCNHLIKSNKAALVENAADIAYALGWDIAARKKPKVQLNLVLNGNEEKIYSLLREAEMGIDEISFKTGLGLNEASLALLEMELNGIVKSLPGKMYRTV